MWWGLLAHLGGNMWEDRADSERVRDDPLVGEAGGRSYELASDQLRLDPPVWDAVIDRMANVGMNLLVVDVGEGMRYSSHPELAVAGSWAPAEMNAEARRLRGLGITAVPKLNFSTAHDVWLGDYQFMVSSPAYYRVCADLIAELAEVFEHPPFFHIGMDEETAVHQRWMRQAVVRQHELWYHDLDFFAQEVTKAGSRPWMWSDRLWLHQEQFLKGVSRDIVQSNWYYADRFDFSDDDADLSEADQRSRVRVRAYDLLDEAGFDQIPCGGNYLSPLNTVRTLEYCGGALDAERFKGYLSAPWAPALEGFRSRLFAAVDQVGEQIRPNQ